MERYLSWSRKLDQNAACIIDVEDFIECSVTFSKSIGFDFFVYAVCEAVPFTRPKMHVFSNYPTPWLQRYKESNYAVADPTIRHCRCSNEPLRWSQELFDGCPQLWSDANDHQLRIGVTQPSCKVGGGIALLSLSRTNKTIDDTEFETLKPIIKAFTETVCSWIFKLDETLNTPLDIELRQKEKEVLRWAADGKTSEEIGRILNVTADTVNFHLRNVQNKLGACNRVQAVTYAVAQGYL
jgi:LuxR family transcriptional activator of rhlAB and lasB